MSEAWVVNASPPILFARNGLLDVIVSEHVSTKTKARTGVEYRRLIEDVILPAIGTKRVLDNHPRPRQTRPGSGLRHVRRDLAGQKVLTHRSEEIDHLRIFGKEGFVLDPTRYHCDVLRLDCSLLTANP